MKCMYFSNTTLFDGRDIYRIYYINISYMFRPLTMAIFRLRLKIEKNLVSSYTRLMWAVYSGEVRGEVINPLAPELFFFNFSTLCI